MNKYIAHSLSKKAHLRVIELDEKHVLKDCHSQKLVHLGKHLVQVIQRGPFYPQTLEIT